MCSLPPGHGKRAVGKSSAFSKRRVTVGACMHGYIEGRVDGRGELAA